MLAVPAPALATERLTKRFRVGVRASRSRAVVHAVESVSIELRWGQTLGVVGESGCGKSTVGRLIAGLLTPTQGTIEFDGRHLASSRAIARHLRGNVEVVFQDPTSALDPRMSIGASVAEPLRGVARAAVRERVRDMLQRVGLPAGTERKRPHELSGGQQQRACIARALVAGQRVLVLDEVVSALDPIVQTQTLDLLGRLRDELGLSYLFISHDLAAIAALSTDVAVMYLGEVVELAPVAWFETSELLHPYSVALLSAKLEPRVGSAMGEVVLKGDVPSPVARPSGCPFHTRCPIARDVCRTDKPPLAEIEPRRWAACHFPGEFRRSS